MYRLLFISFIIAWLAVNDEIAFAQTQPPDLTVTLHDVANAPLAGVTVLVRDASGSRMLAQAATDASGTAIFMGLTESAVRVAIVGALPNGTRLYQPGNDAAGISLMQDQRSTMLELRAAADGMIVPDPAAMAREPGVPIASGGAAIPTAPIAPTISVDRARIPGSPVHLPATADPSAVVADQSGGSGPLWFGVAALILLLGAGAGILVVQRRSA